ncbi:C25 family cysteine peptidase, partial [Candidatus Cloacimonadota bacterium]
MKKTGLFLIILCAFISVYAEWTAIDENYGNEIFTVNSRGLETSEIYFSLTGYELKTELVSGEEYQSVNILEEGEIVEPGKPTLPSLTKLIAIPATGNVNIEIVDQDNIILSNINLLPRQSVDNPVYSETGEFLIDQDFYRSDLLFPADKIRIGDPAVLRGIRVVSVTVSPFQYNPATDELHVTKNLSFRITTDSEMGLNPVTSEMKRSRFFEPLLASSILNYDTLSGTRDEEYQQPCYLFIYGDEDLLTLNNGYNLQDLIDWKKQKGFDVQSFSTDDIGTSTTSILNFIEDAYFEWENPPEFVCLVGDPSSSVNVPCFTHNHNYYAGSTDHNYALLEGNDDLADIFIGRLSVDSDNDMKVIANKILGYEKTPFIGNTDWYTNSLMVGDPSSSGPSCISTCKFVKETMLNYNPEYTFDEHYAGGASNVYLNSINGGISYFAYRGYIGMSGIPSAIGSETNGWMTPFVSCITCGTGSFDGESTSEAFLEAGSATTPKGGIAAVGTATSGTHTLYNNIVTAGMFHGIFNDQLYYPGAALVRGKLALYDNYHGTSGQSSSIPFFYWNNLMGDPGLMLWTGVPQEMTVIYNDEVALGTNTLEVYVEDHQGQPLENAWVTAYNEDMGVFATGFTDLSGLVYLEVSAETAGTVDLTVTSHNCIPHLGNFTIATMEYFLGIDQLLFDDDSYDNSYGNDDGLLNPGETIEIVIGLKNYGLTTLTGVTAELTSSSDGVEVIDAGMSYGDINVGETIYSDGDFVFSLAPNVIGNSTIQLNLEISNDSGLSWNEYISFDVYGADLIYVDYYAFTSGDIDPGETADFYVTLYNDGQIPATGISALLSTEDSRITIDDEIGYFGLIPHQGESSNNSNKFTITPNYGIIPGSLIPMTLSLSNTDGFEQTVIFPIQIGDVSVTDPLGPDAYGYYCYDDGDLDYPDVPEYDWIEIDPDVNNPDYNGSIIDFNINDPWGSGSGDVEVLDLPQNFSFQFYGIAYDQITVCSNGFLAPGVTENYEFMNWHIPGPQGPNPMIAVFWDEIHFDNSSNVCYYFNNTEHYLVVEWSNVENQNGSNQTFQAIIYDSNFYTTTTNDSKIKMQYKEVNNNDTGGYRIEHGQYATVGLENQTALVG